MTDRNSSTRIEELDALRGLAALMIMLFHFTRNVSPLFAFGSTGVDLFFIISGFVIFMSLDRVRTGLDFAISRFSRLYPTYWTCVSFAFILICLKLIFYDHPADLTHRLTGSGIQYLANMTMFQYYFQVKDLDGPYWTMIIEMNFYLVMLLFFHFKILKHINMIGVLSSIIVAAVTSLFFHYPVVQAVVSVAPLLQYLPLFFSGIIFYKIYQDPRNAFVPYTIIAISLICQVLLFYYAGRTKLFISITDYSIMLVIYFFAFILFVNGKLRFIVSKPTLFLGKISFALYLIHQYVTLHYIVPFLIRRFHINYWVGIIFIAIPVVITLATFITYYVEIPMNRMIKKKLRDFFRNKAVAV